MKRLLFLICCCAFQILVSAQEILQEAELQEAQKAVAKVILNESVWSAFTNHNFTYGTGFFIDHETLVTNYHVIAPLLMKSSNASDFEDLLDSSYIERDGKEYAITGVKSISATYDLAVLQIEGYEGPVLELAEEESDSFVMALGFPSVDNTPRNLRTLDFQLITGHLFDQNSPSFCSTSDIPLVINFFGNVKGASGSPVVNRRGQVIGILRSYVGRYGMTACGTRVKYLKELLGQPRVQNIMMYNSIRFQIVSDLNRALKGDSHAQFLLGALLMASLIPRDLYILEEDVLKSGSEKKLEQQLSLHFLKTLVEKKHTAAQSLLGVLYYNLSMPSNSVVINKGKGLVLDFNPALQEEGLKLIETAAHQGEVLSQFELGNIAPDKETRISYLEKSANQNYVPAQYALQRERAEQSFLEIEHDYSSQEGIPDEFTTLQKIMDVQCTWLQGIKEVADRGYPQAQFDLAQYLERMIQAGKDDYIHFAMSLYEKAGDQGHGLAQLRVGQLYYYGYENIVEPDEEKASYWLLRARQNGTFFPFNDDVELLTTLHLIPENPFIVKFFKFFRRTGIRFSQMFEDDKHENYEENDMETFETYMMTNAIEEDGHSVLGQETKDELMEMAIDHFDQCLSHLNVD